MQEYLIRACKPVCRCSNDFKNTQLCPAVILQKCKCNTSKSLNAAGHARHPLDDVTLQRYMYQSERRMFGDPLWKENFALSLEESDVIMFSLSAIVLRLCGLCVPESRPEVLLQYVTEQQRLSLLISDSGSGNECLFFTISGIHR